MKKIILYIALISFSITSCNGRIRETEQIKATTSLNTSPDKFIEGKVTRIADGDTFTLIFDNGFDVRVRLNGIDSPEKKQAFSKRAKQTLSDLIFDKEVKVYYKSKDRYGRVLGDVYVGEVNINHEMVRRGMAWHFTRYSEDETLAALEKEAKKNKIGLWAEAEPVAPWVYRDKQ
ncbi:MAG: thermonuclease family protein [Flavobacteriales bacterium]|nr:thermonuclease family protein [Flavobacteriales bacterium]NCP83927.1 thermonuclease family protein [Bacteroidota bacterium]